MKYWNKSKKYRESWIVVAGPQYFTDHAKQWCQQQSSKGRFYYSSSTQCNTKVGIIYYNWKWYFENSEDAPIFKLKFQTGNFYEQI